MASSTDSPGPITKTIEDAGLVLKILAGKDKFDATTSEKKAPDYLKDMKKSMRELSVGIPKEYFIKEMDKEVIEKVKKAIELFKNRGITIKEVSLLDPNYSVAVYTVIQRSEVSSNLARYDGIRFGPSVKDARTLEELYEKTREKGFEDEVKRRIMLGTYALSAGYYDEYYKKAMKVRTVLKQEFDDAFKKVDVILAPVSPSPPFLIGKHENDPLAMWLEDVFTETVNPTGCPSLAIPSGFTKAGLPVGMQIIGPQFSEDVLFRLGYHFQNATDYHEKLPPLLKD